MSHVRDTSPKPYGVVAEFDNSDALLEAAEKVKAAGYRDVDAYTPIPVHGLTDVLEWKDDKLGWVVFFHGIAGFAAGYFLQWWTSQGIPVSNTALQVNGLLPYPMNVGGKPEFSIPAFFPPAYELTILLAAFGAVFGMIAFNGLPKPHHPVFNAACMNRASSDRYVLCVEATDPRYDEDEIEELMNGLGSLSIERVMTSEGY
jgi:hypothetical protein